MTNEELLRLYDTCKTSNEVDLLVDKYLLEQQTKSNNKCSFQHSWLTMRTQNKRSNRELELILND